MDSRLIFAACTEKLSSIDWPRIGNAKDSSEWVYTGVDDDFKTELASKILEVFSEDPNVFLVKGRRDSAEISTTDLLRVVRDNNFRLTLMKTDYTAAVEFKGDVCKVGYRR